PTPPAGAGTRGPRTMPPACASTGPGITGAGDARSGSVVALDREAGQRTQCPGPFAEAGERVVHCPVQRQQALARGLDAQQRGEGRLAQRGVLARGLAQGRAVALDVEQVVADLESETERIGE